jgi:hypothetical protein
MDSTVMDNELFALSPYDNFVYALKAEATKLQYPRELDRFLSFIGLEGTIQEKWSCIEDTAGTVTGKSDSQMTKKFHDVLKQIVQNLR